MKDSPTDDSTTDDSTTEESTASPASGGGRKRTWVVRALLLIMGALVVGAVLGVIAIALIARDLPTLRSLGDYHPPQATVVFGVHGEVVARFAEERRTVVPYARVPPLMIEAVLAAEDDQFFQHQGIDYMGMVRCFGKNLVAGRTKCGASTITQQMVKTLLLSSEQTYTRKLKEIILAKRVEDALSKDDILFLYLNQIYFGHRAYGVQEAARVYFGKDVADIKLDEAAFLAGVVQSPSRLDPYRHPEAAVKRRAYVLRRMLEIGRIDRAAYEAAVDAPINLAWGIGEEYIDNNNHYSAHVRRMLSEILDEEQIRTGGLRVYTGMDPKLQDEAQVALEAGLRALDKRQGWRGPLLHLERDQLGTVRERLEARIAHLAPRGTETSTVPRGPVVADLSRVNDLPAETPLDQLMAYARFPRLALDGIYGGIVERVDDASRRAVVSLGPLVRVVLPFQTGVRWARPFSTRSKKAHPKSVSDVLSVGDIVLVRPTKKRTSTKEDKARAQTQAQAQAQAPVVEEYTGVLEQPPKAQAALVTIDPFSRELRAMVGGYGVGAGRFNRAVQAKRQAGSTFKPFVYLAAFETGDYSPISECIDRPYVEYDPWRQRTWKPENYGGKFDGRITLRTALTRSKNLCSVRLIKAVGVPHVIDVAQRAGISSPLPQSLTLSLGSGEVTVLEMANAYATIAAQGLFKDPVVIRRVVDGTGHVLFEAKAPSKQAVRPEIAYQIISMMESVVQDGTARSVKSLGRPVAGKTGTTNDAKDAWFIGFTPDLVTAVWVGFDDSKPLGPSETGGRAAIPIWLDFMKKATANQPVREFVPPPGVVFVLVDPETGKLASPGHEGARLEPFVAGSEPTEYSAPDERPVDFGSEEYR
ncbi:MAG: PBP1A family penicillin-binding protein [Deltaproteobacteria bacterium]|nr:PBP1A family penicillin-binding protein [Deltaproteobacteria bacterium]